MNLEKGWLNRAAERLKVPTVEAARAQAYKELFEGCPNHQSYRCKAKPKCPRCMELFLLKQTVDKLEQELIKNSKAALDLEALRLKRSTEIAESYKNSHQ